jgi:hypothetical protein
MPRKIHGFTEGEAPPAVLGMPASAYNLNGDLAQVAGDLIASHETLAHLRNFALAYLRRTSQRTDNEFHVDKASGAFVRSDRERGITAAYDAGIWVQGKAWDGFDPRTRRAWVHSLLLRLQTTPTGTLKRVRPDVSEFAEVVREHGAWGDALQQLALGFDAHGQAQALTSTAAADTAALKRLGAATPPQQH